MIQVRRAAASPSRWLRPYRAAFGSRFIAVLQYRTAALAGFATQCWWGGIKVMVLAAFYRAASSEAALPLSLANVITYTWVAQGLLGLLPWAADPEVVLAVRSGNVAYDRLRPVDAYGFWYVRSAGWLVARALPRALLLIAFAAVTLPLIGLTEWAWRPPASVMAAAAFVISIALSVLLSAATLMLINVAVVALRDERGVVALMSSLVVVFSGNLLPLALFPDSLGAALLLQPLAGLLDIPLRIYFAQLSGPAALAAMGLQLFWTLTLVAFGRRALVLALRRLDVQGG